MTCSLVTHFAVLVVGLVLGIGAVAAADGDVPAQPSATDRGVVRELRKLENLVGTSQYDSGSLRYDLKNQIGNPFSPSLKELLRDICENTSTSTFTSC